MGRLKLSQVDVERISELPSNPGFLALIKTVRAHLEPEYFERMESAKNSEEKIAALDSYVAFTKVFSTLALYPQEIKYRIGNSEEQGE